MERAKSIVMRGATIDFIAEKPYNTAIALGCDLGLGADLNMGQGSH